MIEESDSEHPESESHQKLAVDYSEKMDNRSRRKRYSERIKAQKSFFLAALFLISMAVAPQLVSMNTDTPFSPTARGPEWGCMDDGTYLWENLDQPHIGPMNSELTNYSNLTSYPDVFYSNLNSTYYWKILGNFSIEFSLKYQFPATSLFLVNYRDGSFHGYENYTSVRINSEIFDSDIITSIIFELHNESSQYKASDYLGYKQLIRAYCEGHIDGYHIFSSNESENNSNFLDA